MCHSRDLIDEQWKALDALIPKPRTRSDGRRARPWKGRRSVINGIHWVLRTGTLGAMEISFYRGLRGLLLIGGIQSPRQAHTTSRLVMWEQNRVSTIPSTCSPPLIVKRSGRPGCANWHLMPSLHAMRSGL